MENKIQYKRGLKAGFFSALIGYSISLITFVVLDSFDRYTPSSGITALDYMISAFLVTVIIGCLLGLAFAAVYRFIPTQRSISKAIIFNSVLGLLDLSVFFFSATSRAETLIFFNSATNYLIFLVLFGVIIDGTYFGWLYDLFGRAEAVKPVEKPKKKPARKKKSSKKRRK